MEALPPSVCSSSAGAGARTGDAALRAVRDRAVAQRENRGQSRSSP